MAITDKEKGVWGLDQVYNKINQGSIWEYSGAAGGFWAWGKNTIGYLAQNDTVNRSSSVQIPGTTWNFPPSTSGGNSIIMTKTDGTLWSWGYNYLGGLGHNQGPGQLTGLSSPAQIGSGTNWDTSYSYQGIGAAINTSAELWMWGDGRNGELGQNESLNGAPGWGGPSNLRKSSPVQVPGTTWSTLSVSAAPAVYGVKTDGTLWVWGYGFIGQLAQNNQVNYSSPVQIPGTTWAYAKGSSANGAAVKTDGTLWMWGRNPAGQLGQNSTDSTNTGRSSPVQVDGTTWKTDERGFAVANENAYGIKTDGTLWAWGKNVFGQLGQNNKTYYSSPTQIPGTTWKTVSSAYAPGSPCVIATKTDNTAWGWGDNEAGRLGLNSETQYSSPVMIPGNWTYAQLTTGAFSFGEKIL